MPSTSPSHRSALLLFAALAAACGGSSDPGPYVVGQPLTLKVAPTFAAGAKVKDRYSGKALTVAADGTVSLTPDANGLVLLEKDGATPTPFNWQNATVYFAVTDRFNNGDTSNDHSYGRQGDGVDEIGTWHGGDLKGLTAKLGYLQDLGVTAIWITSVVEQVHGWVSGGQTGTFKHYGYHGYWALDWTRLDKNLGTEQDLHDFIDGAHAKGMRVLLDVVINHPGYATGEDLFTWLPEIFKDGTGAAYKAFAAAGPGSGQSWTNWNDLVDYRSAGWTKWWGPKWVRAGLGPAGVFDSADPNDPLTMSLTFLPDMKTESAVVAPVPAFFSGKADTGVTPIAGGGTPIQYLSKWHADWVRNYGFDGFRCDTAKNVDVPSWKTLKTTVAPALAEWKAKNPTKKLDDAPFWMTGEVYGHGLAKDEYYTNGGFDSLINFKFQPDLQNLFLVQKTLAAGAAVLDDEYATIAGLVSKDPGFDVLNYLSSHDTRLFYSLYNYDPKIQKQAGTALLLAPGGAQIFYGDESGRKLGPAAGDSVQGTRSDMNWSSTEPTILAHWQKVGTFRRDHAAIGAGAHARITSPAGTYAFSRTLPGGDAVIVAITEAQ